MLDSETEMGQLYIQQESLVSDHISKLTQAEAVRLGSNTTHADRLFIRDGKSVCIAEIKTRNMSMLQLEKFGSYLISYHKIDRGVLLSSLLHVPFMLFVYLIESDDIVYWTISNEEGREVCSYVVEQTSTQATCNGGEALRENAYLYLDGMQILSNVSLIVG